MIAPESKTRILIVEDDNATAELEERAFRRVGFDVVVAKSLDQAILLMNGPPPAVVVLDYNLGVNPGWPILEMGVASNPPIPTIMVTAMGDEKLASEAISRGATDYVIKTGKFVERLLQSVDSTMRVARAEQALRQMKDWQSAILGSVDAHIALLTESGEILLVNEAWTQFTEENGFTDPSYGPGSNYFTVADGVRGMEGGYAKKAAEGLRCVLEARTSKFSLEYPCNLSTNLRWFRVDVSPLRHDGGKGAVVMHVDITARVLAEEMRLENAELLHNILQSVDEGILVVDREGALLKWNVAAEKILGEEVESHARQWREWLRPLPGSRGGVISETVEFPLALALEGKVVTEQELCILCSGQVQVCLSVSARPLTDTQGQVRGAVATFRDITDRIARDIEIRRIAVAVEQTADAIIFADTDSKIEYINPAFERIFGFSADEVIGKDMRFLRSDDQESDTFSSIQNTLKLGDTWTGRLVNNTKSGAECITDATITPVRDTEGRTSFYVSTERDVSKQVAYETRTRQSQKLEAIGVLAGGIAHDFNNILAAIDGYTNMALDDLENTDQVREDLSYVTQGARRAKALVRQILTFSRQTSADMKVVFLDLIIQESVELMRATLPTTVAIRMVLDANKIPVLGDATQLQQIIINLCTNAAHAMTEKGGSLEIRLKKISLRDGSETLAALGLSAGYYALMEVEDHGIGIPSDLRTRIFEPFFSTKKDVGGTGLGLSTVLGIVKEHGGDLLLESESGVGTTFQVYLPLSHAVERRKRPRKIDSLPRGSGQRVLIVDDEMAIARLSGRILTNLGYTVDVYEQPLEALAAFRAAPESYDALLTDLTMPELTGDKLAHAIHEIRSDFPVVLLSGYSDEKKLEALGIFRVLEKPTQMADLANALHDALQWKSPPAGDSNDTC